MNHQQDQAAPAPDRRAFLFDGATYTAAQMLAANAHDADVCTWVVSAKPGDVYVGVVPVECRVAATAQAKHLDVIEALTVLQLHPGDALVVRVAGHLSQEQAKQLRDHVRAALAPAFEVPILVLDQDMELGALRAAS